MAHEPFPRRDAGLRRVSRVTRTAVAGGVAATGVFAALAAHAFSGTPAQQSTTPATTDPDATQGFASSSPSSPSAGRTTPTTVAPLRAPATTVQPSTRRGRVTSGGS